MSEARTRSRINANEMSSGGNSIFSEYRGTCTSQTLVASTNTVNSSYSMMSDSEVMHDVVDENFYSLRKQGKIFNNAMDKTRTIIEEPPVDLGGTVVWEELACTPQKWYARATRNYNFTGLKPSSRSWWPAFLPLPDLDVESLVSRAVTSAHAKVGADEILLLVSLAEGKKTVATLVNCSHKLNGVLRLVKKDHRYKAWRYFSMNQKGNWRRILNDASDLWLEARYGIRPLIYDYRGALAALNSVVKGTRQTFRGWESDTSEEQDAYVLPKVWEWAVDAPAWQEAAVQRSSYSSVKVRAGVLTQLDSITHLNIWGIDKVPESVLELIPYSFIVNWFFNISDTVSSWTPNMGVKELASWVTVERTDIQQIACSVTCKTTVLGADRTLGALLYSGPLYKSVTTITKTRTPNPQLAVLPRLNVNLDTAKLIDLVLIGRNLWQSGGISSVSSMVRSVEARKGRRS